MGLFSSDDEDRLRQLFATEQLDEVAWRDSVDDFANGASMVDVVVSSPKPALLQNVGFIGLTYWPDGPVVRGVQSYTQGTSVTLRNVPVKPGGTLAVAASTNWGDSMPLRVDVVPVGGGASVERERQDKTPAPWEALLKDTSTLLAVVVGLGLLYLAVKLKD